MKRTIISLYVLGFICAFTIEVAGQAISIGTITATRETQAHDPVIIKQNEKFYLFTTGNGISVSSSTDLKNWKKEPPVFAKVPEWVYAALPRYKGSSMWAPDISYHNGYYYLYYAVSVFGKNTSCIGLVVNKTLDVNSADYKWQDKGKVIQSVPGRDMWNAIDANLIIDDQHIPWLSFGSFWEGIKMVKLNDDLTTIAQPEEWVTIAKRTRKPDTPDSLAGDAAIEAPFIFKKNNYYYLFVSWDYCCRGERSDYKVVVGRSKKVTGPYLDKSGTEMMKNGGSLLVEGDNKEWNGVGHNSVYTFEGQDYTVYHGYDANDRGRAKLIIKKIQWENDWPVIVP